MGAERVHINRSSGISFGVGEGLVVVLVAVVIPYALWDGKLYNTFTMNERFI